MSQSGYLSVEATPWLLQRCKKSPRRRRRVVTGSRSISGILWCRSTGDHPSMRPTREFPKADGRSPPCMALLRMGFAEPQRSLPALVRSYRTVSPSPVPSHPSHRRSLSVALSVRSPRPGSRQHPALWSPDFPRRSQATPRSPERLPVAAECTGQQDW